MTAEHHPRSPMPDIVSAETTASNAMPAIVAVAKREENDMWVVTLAGNLKVVVSTSELHSNRKFLIECINQLSRAFAPTGRRAWTQMIDEKLRRLEEKAEVNEEKEEKTE